MVGTGRRGTEGKVQDGEGRRWRYMKGKVEELKRWEGEDVRKRR